MITNPQDLYVCPKCKGRLQAKPQVLACPACGRDFPLDAGIPDFLLVRPQESPNPILRNIRIYGWLAGIYESSWYSFLLNLYAGAGALSFQDLVAYVRRVIQPVKGKVLDVGTGTATYGRRVSGGGREVFGIDLSLEMMRVGQRYLRREGVSQMSLARADVEALPFEDGFFSGCIAGGCLHLFPDKLKALREIRRTLRPGAPLAVITFTWGDTGLLKYEWLRRRVRARGRAQPFTIPEIEGLLAQSGFQGLEPAVKGSILMFAARATG